MEILYNKYADEFEHVFNVPLSQYWDNRVGILLLPLWTQVIEFDGASKDQDALIRRILEDMASVW